MILASLLGRYCHRTIEIPHGVAQVEAK